MRRLGFCFSEILRWLMVHTLKLYQAFLQRSRRCLLILVAWTSACPLPGLLPPLAIGAIPQVMPQSLQRAEQSFLNQFVKQFAPIAEQRASGVLIAQAPLVIPSEQMGDRVRLNGRSIVARWSQRESQIGITDADLNRLLGVEFLNSADPDQQPVGWFSGAAEPLTLAAWWSTRHRFLDVTALAQQAGWQLQTDGTTLSISTPAAQITRIRHSTQDWGDRVVLDLDRATPLQVDQSDGSFTLVVDAQTDSAVLENYALQPNSRLTSFQTETAASQTTFKLSTSGDLPARVWTLTDPDRIVIDFYPTADIRNLDMAWAPGIWHREQIIQVGNAQFPVIYLEINPRQSGLSLQPIWGDGTMVEGINPLLAMVERWDAIAAINGGFFNRNNQLPLGAIRLDQRWISGPILNRGVIAWNAEGDVTIDRVRLQETLTTDRGEQFSVQHLNSGYVQAGLSRYTPDWGSAYTSLTDYETLVTVQNDQVTHQQRVEQAGETPVTIPADGYLIAIRADSRAVNALSIGTILNLENTVTPDLSEYSDAIGAGPLLLKNNVSVLDPALEQFSAAFSQQSAPRSAIGRTPEGTLILATIQQRIGGTGPSLNETAQIMKSLGTSDALNLDGGSSTTLVLSEQILNRSPQTVARVHNGVGIFLQPSGSE